MHDTLRILAARGYTPRIVIDGGANVGQWAAVAAPIFYEAQFHLIEPQAACHPFLVDRFPPPRFELHRCVITAPGLTEVRIAGGGDGRGTGAFVVSERDATPRDDLATVPATTLDRLFASVVSGRDRALLKLDLEGHELEALRGAEALLAKLEIIVCELSFYDFGTEGHPLFGDLVCYLRERGFVVHDIASLNARPRDHRLRMGDAVFVRKGAPLTRDASWE